VKAVQYTKSIPRYLAVRALSSRARGAATGPLSLLRHADVDPPPLPSGRWIRVRTRLSGICGSDLATVCAKGSPYFSPFISTPFVLGHEVVGEVAETGADVEDVSVGDRIVIEPALHCTVRDISPVCQPCSRGRYAACENVLRGNLAPGIQTGYCRDTGGGWSPEFVAHERQAVRVPDGVSDEAAVLIEPFACALHGVLRASVVPGQSVLILGCGTIGLLTIAALRGLGFDNDILASAKHPRQKELALSLGATAIVPTGATLYDELPRATGATVLHPEIGKPVLIGGVDVTFDCVGASSTIDDAVRMTRSGGEVILVGMPSIPTGVDWTNIWHKELRVQGAYAYGIERWRDTHTRTFALAMQLIRDAEELLVPLVDAKYPLHRYREAILNALHSGRRGSVKTVFEFPPD
jgi:threonine dehydrogenase-like Zn-dependent dehydrogenase